MPLYTFREKHRLSLDKIKPIVIDSYENADESAVVAYYENRLSLLGESGKAFVMLPEGKLPLDLFLRLRDLFARYAEDREKLKIVLLYDSVDTEGIDPEKLSAYVQQLFIRERVMFQGVIFRQEMIYSFRSILFRYLKEKNISEVECYKKANLDRRTFSKIRSDDDYRPSKSTVIALAIALELDFKETEELLGSAGFGLSRFYIEDVIVRYFIESRNYDIFAVNEALFDYNCRPLGF